MADKINKRFIKAIERSRTRISEMHFIDRNSVLRMVATATVLAATLIGFQNCSGGFSSLAPNLNPASASNNLPSLPLMPGGEENYAPSPPTNSYALLSSDQVLRSMMSVTGTGPAPNVNQEYSRQSPVLATDFKLSSVTPPMMIAITNLASAFCINELNIEKALPAAQRRFYGAVDFGQGVGAVTDAIFTQTAGQLAQSFWGRSLSTVETGILLDGRNDFISGFAANDLSSRLNTQNLMVYTCSAMLASFDAISF